MKSDEATAMQPSPAANKEPVQHSAAFKRKRKMLVMLPLICLPFISLAFWALGGGQSLNDNEQPATAGLLLNLPDSKLKENDPTDKLRFYEEAEKDSLQLEEWMRTDPYYRQNRDSNTAAVNELKMLTQQTASKYNYQLNNSPYGNRSTDTEDELMQKLALLQEQLQATPAPDKLSSSVAGTEKDDLFSSEVDRLNLIMQQMQNSNQDNPEMKAIQGTLEKILDIQHPDRVKQKMKEKQTEELSNVFPVFSADATDTTINGFFSLDNKTAASRSNAIEAVVNENQVLVNGAVIKLRLLQDVYISESKIPVGNFVFGAVTLNGERLEIAINSIRYGNSIFPVKLEVYDMDGLSGIYIPGAISRDVVKQSADNSLQLMELSSFDPSLKAQAAAAGINTVKSLLSRKVKQVKVMVKAGYKVLLKDKSVQQ